MSAASRLTSSFVAIVAVATLVCSAPALRAQDSAAPNVENSKHQARGEVNANDVFVRSGPSENDYPVMKLERGAQLTVVGIRFEWLKIVPPEGSFCYVSKAYVDRHGDGKQGRVTNTLNVRVGSMLNQMKTKLATKLEPGSTVQIVGEQDEYFKIVPPDGVYLYVNRQFVDAKQVIEPNDGAKPMTPDADKPTVADGSKPQDGSSSEQMQPPAQPEQPQGQGTEMAMNGGPGAAGENAAAPTTAPSTQPAMADAGSMFDKCEEQYAMMSKMPLDQQDIPSMLADYEKLAAANSGLPETLRRIAEAKAGYLKSRMKDREEFLAVQKQQAEMQARQQALQAEREEIEERIKANSMKYYVAVGVLRPSSIQNGPTTLYRLTDPANGRTVVYIRTNDNKVGSMMGQFIGVKGQVSQDEQVGMRVISPTECEPCEASKLYNGVVAQIVPPSLMPGGGASATTGNE